jgi:hypothetical protein
VSTETARQKANEWPSQSGAKLGPLVYLRDRRLALIVTLALLAGILAYQTPPVSDIPIGWLGDRLFLSSSQGLGADDARTFYGDEITGDAGARSRWTRQEAEIRLPGLGMSGDLLVTVRALGWPDQPSGAPAAQPTVRVSANGVPAEPPTFQPTGAWADHTFRVPASALTRDPLTLTLEITPTFASAGDPRPKGIRIDYLRVRGADRAAGLTRPAPFPLALLILDGALCMLTLVLATRRPTLAFVLTTLLISGAAVALALARIWAAALLPWAGALLAALLVLTLWRSLVGLITKLLHRYARGAALNYGLVALVAAWLAYIAARASQALPLPGVRLFSENFPDSLLYGLLGMGLLLLILVRGRDGLPRLARAIVALVGSPYGSFTLLMLCGAIWIGYETFVVAQLPYVGHADYADNAVVARNLAAGRGWVVDYVTQFYELYGGITRPQQTWPLLQPVWIAPFFLLFGATNWAAKIPNLIFISLLTLSIYHVGARIWDRRVGLCAALLILTNYLFFRLVIYVTSDLAFVVFSFGAIYLLYRALDVRTENQEPRTNQREAPSGSWFSVLGSSDRGVSLPLLLGSGALTGLMMLQKPSGALIAFGMGLWLLARIWRRGAEPGRQRSAALLRPLVPAIVWGGLALAILSPYLVRNFLEFRRPFYSTESHDAWVLGYGDWEDIYRVYTTSGGISAAGVPDRSWVLRWGFDVTALKLATQVKATRDYLLPPWFDQSRQLSDDDSEKKALLFGMGAWLSLLGLLGVLRSRRSLFALLALAFGPYMVFLVVYWHANEERYFLMIMPWMALLACYALWRGYDRVAAIGDGRWAPAGLVLAVAALVLIAAPSWPYNAKKLREEPALYRADTDAYTWLRAHSAPGDVVMTRLPWQLNWVSDRPALMVPNTGDAELILRLARYYHARYLVRDTFAQPSDAARGALQQLIDTRVLQEAYATPPYPATVDGRPVNLVTRVYRFPDDYDGAAAINPALAPPAAR